MHIERWSLRFRIFLWFTFLVCCAVAIAELALVLGYRLHGQSGPLGALFFAGALSGFGILAVSFWVWKLFDDHMAKPIGSVSNALLASAHTDKASALIAPDVRYLGNLGDAVNAVGQELNKTRTALAQTQVHDKLQLIDDTEKLAALAADVPFGLMLLSSTHNIALYNGLARALCQGKQKFGLGQALFDLLDEAPITSAYNRLCMPGSDPNHILSFPVHLKNSSKTLSARMHLMHDAQNISARPPYVLTLEDDTQQTALQKARDNLGQSALQQLADIGATLQLAQSARGYVSPDLDINELNHALENSLIKAADRALTLNAEFQGLGFAAPSAQPVSGQDICDNVIAYLSTHGIKLAASVPLPLSLNIEADRLTDLIVYVAQQLIRDGAKGLSMLITPEDTGALIALGWSGEVLYMDRLNTWLADPSKFGFPHTQGQAFLDEMQTEIWPELGIGARRVIKLPIANTPAKPKQPLREASYDFKILTQLDAN